MVAALDVLVVAATERELADGLPCPTLLCGVGPVDAAARVGAALADLRPAAILHVGIAGARRAAGIGPAQLVIGSAACYTDLAVPEEFAPRELVPDARLLAAARAALPHAQVLPIATVARVGGSITGAGESAATAVARTRHCDVEAMEGFAVLRAAQLAGIPALEVRAISNDIEETNRSKWHFDHAFSAITAATPRLVEAIAACVR
jgi:nucleoside phosphorylase